MTQSATPSSTVSEVDAASELREFAKLVGLIRQFRPCVSFRRLDEEELTVAARRVLGSSSRRLRVVAEIGEGKAWSNVTAFNRCVVARLRDRARCGSARRRSSTFAWYRFAISALYALDVGADVLIPQQSTQDSGP